MEDDLKQRKEKEVADIHTAFLYCLLAGCSVLLADRILPLRDKLVQPFVALHGHHHLAPQHSLIVHLKPLMFLLPSFL